MARVQWHNSTNRQQFSLCSNRSYCSFKNNLLGDDELNLDALVFLSDAVTRELHCIDSIKSETTLNLSSKSQSPPVGLSVGCAALVPPPPSKSKGVLQKSSSVSFQLQIASSIFTITHHLMECGCVVISQNCSLQSRRDIRCLYYLTLQNNID